MNPGWVQAGVTVAANLLVAAFVYGQLTQRQKDQGRELREVKDEQLEHRAQLLDHEGRISHIEGRKGMPHGGN